MGRKYRKVTIKTNPRNDAGRGAYPLLERAREYQKENQKSNLDFDEIWIIFDVDDIPESTINRVIQEARDSKIKIAISNPCFELWLVLHYQDQTGYIERRDIQRMAKSLNIVDGKDIAIGAHQTLIDKYDQAITRARKLETMHKGNGSKLWENPSSQIWEFVDLMLKWNEESP